MNEREKAVLRDRVARARVDASGGFRRQEPGPRPRKLPSPLPPEVMATTKRSEPDPIFSKLVASEPEARAAMRDVEAARSKLARADEKFQAPHPTVVFARLELLRAIERAEAVARRLEGRTARAMKPRAVRRRTLKTGKCGWCGVAVPKWATACVDHRDVEEEFSRSAADSSTIEIAATDNGGGSNGNG